MAVRAGQAFIAIEPSFAGFKTKTEAWVKSNLRAIEVEIKPKVSDKPIILPPVKGKDVKVNVDVDRSGFERSVSAIESRLDRLSRGRFLINVGIALAPLAAPALAAAVGAAVSGAGLLAAGVAGIASVAAIGTASLKRLQTEQKAITTTTKAHTEAVKTLQSAEEALSSAERSAAGARVAAARQIEAAERGVTDAEGRLKESQDKVKDSLKALHDARQQAIKDLEDLKERTSDDALSQESAEIGLIDAQNELARVEADSTSTALDLRKAKLGVAEAEDALADARKQGADDAAALAKAEKDGTAGAPGVVAAKKALADAEADRDKAEQGVARARQDLAEARADAARQIADANAAVAVAQSHVAAAQVAASAAQVAQAKALAALSPAQKAAADGIDRLKKNWNGFLDEIDPTLLGALVIGMDALGKALPAVALFMEPVADAAGLMFDAFGNAAGTAGFKIFAQQFGIFTASIAGDATQIILNLAKAFGNLFLAFMPLSTDMSKGLVGLTADFANWTAGLSGSDGFTAFTEYVKTNGPLILSTLGSLGLAFLAIGKASAPLGHDLLIIITAVANFVAGFAVAHPSITAGIVGFISLSSAVSALAVPLAKMVGLFRIISSPIFDAVRALVLHNAAVRAGTADSIAFQIQFALLRAQEIATAAATKVLAAGQWLLNAALTANPIGLVIVGLVALGAAFIVMYEKVGWFRDGVNAMWGALQTGFFWVRDNWPLLLIILTGPIGLAVVPIVKNWNTIVGGAKGVFGWIKDNWPLLLIILTGPIGAAVVLIVKHYKTIKDGADDIVSAFRTMGNKIGDIWDGVGDAILNPLTTIKKALNVFFAGIDKIASFFGGSFNFRFDVSTPVKKNVSGSTHSDPIAMASGGVLPGWSPGRDIHTFTSPTGGVLHLSGGESIMVPEWTAAQGGEKEVQRQNAAARRGQPFASGGVVWPTKSRHWTTYAGHDGIDLNGPGNGLGDPYFAAKSGTVAYTGTGRGYGDAVFLAIPGGPTLTYGHSSQVNVHAGQSVSAGQVMGKIGYSGHVIPAGPAGSHLHFGLVGEGPDEGKAALAFLGGASMPSGGGSGFDPLSEIKSLIKETTGLLSNLHAGPFGNLMGKAPEKIGSLAIEWAKKKLNPLDDIKDFADKLNPFDDGGIAASAGLMVKKTVSPERVLSPRQTAAFESALDRSFESTAVLRTLTDQLAAMRDVEDGIGGIRTDMAQIPKKVQQLIRQGG